jgi:hypothetical protein
MIAKISVCVCIDLMTCAGGCQKLVALQLWQHYKVGTVATVPRAYEDLIRACSQQQSLPSTVECSRVACTEPPDR